MGICDETDFIEEGKRKAAKNGWSFEAVKGELSLLGNLFDGKWENDFLVVSPGREIAASNDSEILAAR